MSVRGVKKCQCNPFDRFGWDAALRNPLSDISAFSGISAVKVSGVLARFINQNNNIESGQIPPNSDPNWGVGLPANVSLGETAIQYLGENGPPDFRWSNGICGVRVFNDFGRWFVAYVLTYNGLLEDIFDESHFPTHAGIIDVDKQELVATCLLPTVDPGLYSPFWYAEMQGNYGALGTGHSPRFAPVLHGFSRDTWVISGAYDTPFVQGIGAAFIQRHKFSTGESAIALGSHSLTESGVIIQLPAQAANDGRAWCVGKAIDGCEIWTGPWENEDVGDITNPSAFSAELKGDDLVNRLDTATGFPSGSITNGYSIGILAYTRLHGYDYVLMEILASNARWYYDGRQGQWFNASSTRFTNIYAFDNGDVVLASEDDCKYLNFADSSQNWYIQASSPDIDLRGGVRISGNGKWVHLGAWRIHRDDIFETSSADMATFGTIKWHGEDPDNVVGIGSSIYEENAWNVALSRRKEGSGPIVVIHREYDGKNYYGTTYFPGVDTEESTYTNRTYLANRNLINWAIEPAAGTHYFATQPMWNFEAVPACECCASQPDDRAGF